MKFFVTGGAKITSDVIERFTGYGIAMYQGYGLSETSPIISATGPRANKIGSVGKVMHSLKVRIDNPDEKNEGEILVTGPSIFNGYFEDDEATKAVLRNGWFYTGDVGKFDEAGNLYITGRKKDIIVTANGKNIYPEEIEGLLKESPYFNEVAVLGLDSPRGELVHAVVYVGDKVPKGAQEKAFVWKEIERLSETLADYKRPAGVTVFRTELPKTSTRKVRKHVLKEMLMKGDVPQAEVTEQTEKTLLRENNEKEKWLAEKLRQISKREDIAYESSLKQELGIDSLTFMELVSGIETQWGVRIAEEDFPKMEKVSDVLGRMGESGARAKERPQKEILVDYDFRRNNTLWMNTLRFLFHILFLRPMFMTFWRLRVLNKEAFTGIDNVVFTPNHSSHLDFPAVVAALPMNRINSTYAVAAADYFFNTPIKAFFVRCFFNAIPFDRKLRVEKGFRICEQILEAGHSLLIFPEGTRSVTGELSSFKPGVGRLLAGTGIRAVPIYIKGAYDAFPKGASFPKPHKVEMVVGAPFKFTELQPNLQGYREVAARIEVAVKAMQGNVNSKT